MANKSVECTRFVTDILPVVYPRSQYWHSCDLVNRFSSRRLRCSPFWPPDNPSNHHQLMNADAGPAYAHDIQDVIISDAESASNVSHQEAITCHASTDKDLPNPSPPFHQLSLQLPIEIWLQVLMFLQDPSQLVLINKEMAKSALTVFAFHDRDLISRTAVTIQTRYIIARYGLTNALPNLPRWSFFTKGPSAFRTIQSKFPKDARGECQFCAPYYKLKQDIAMKQQKRWFKRVRRRLFAVWLKVWQCSQWIWGYLVWVYLSLTRGILLFCCRNSRRHRIVQLEVKKSEVVTIAALREVVLVIGSDEDVREGRCNDAMSLDWIVRDEVRKAHATPCRLERHQIVLLSTLVRLGATEDLKPVIEYAAHICHLNLLAVIVAYTTDPHADENEGDSPAYLLNGNLLLESVKRQNYRLMRHLCVHSQAARPHNRGERALEQAVIQRDPRALQILINNGAKTVALAEGEDMVSTARMLLEQLRKAMIRRVIGLPMLEGGRSQRIIEALILALYRPENSVAFLEFADTLLVPMLVEIGNVGLLRAAWDCGADFDVNETNALFISVLCGHWRVVRFLAHEVAKIGVLDLEAERRRIKIAWRVRRPRSKRDSFLLELLGIYIKLTLRQWKRGRWILGRIPESKTYERHSGGIRVVPDETNANSVTFIPPPPADFDPNGASNDVVLLLPSASEPRKRFFNLESGIPRCRILHFESMLRLRRVIALCVIVILHCVVVFWFLYNLTYMVIAVYCYAKNSGNTTRELYRVSTYNDGRKRGRRQGYEEVYYYTWGNKTYSQIYSSKIYTDTSCSECGYSRKNDDSSYQVAVILTGWCSTQCGTGLLDQDYWFKNGAVLFILGLAVFLAERTMPVYGMVLGIFEVWAWLLKRRLLRKIVELKRRQVV
ncbi:hypothetical protein BC830DRAFT_143655 [Chytriomyces sp. MP71]|nr:hypothetical protein BC830DRAFT_143655 [Chytriomyces sp. MP71]